MSRKRFEALDAARAVAILALIAAHFAPGVFERLEVPASLEYSIRLFGRFATPAFVAIFGLTLGYVHYPRYVADSGKISRRLLHRAALVAGCAILVKLPQMPATPPSEGWGLVATSLLSVYGILSFYAIAIAFSPAALLGAKVSWYPVAFLLTMGLSLWGLGWGLGSSWPYSEGGTEVLRLYLASGKYAFFSMFGTAMIMAGVGVWLQRGMTRRPLLTLMQLGSAGIMLAATGWGALTGLGFLKLGLDDLGAFGAPPHPAFFAAAVGVAVTLLAIFALGLEAVPAIALPLRPLSLLGRCALPVYTAHAFVLPLTSLGRWVRAPEAVAIAAPLAVFSAFTVWQIYRQSQRDRERSRRDALAENSD